MKWKSDYITSGQKILYPRDSGPVCFYYQIHKMSADELFNGQRYFMVQSPVPAYKTWRPPWPASQVIDHSEKIWRVIDNEVVIYQNGSASTVIDEAEFMLVKIGAQPLHY